MKSEPGADCTHTPLDGKGLFWFHQTTGSCFLQLESFRYFFADWTDLIGGMLLKRFAPGLWSPIKVIFKVHTKAFHHHSFSSSGCPSVLLLLNVFHLRMMEVSVFFRVFLLQIGGLFGFSGLYNSINQCLWFCSEKKITFFVLHPFPINILFRALTTRLFFLKAELLWVLLANSKWIDICCSLTRP